MKILTAEQIRQADAYTIAHEPIASIDLMERAAKSCFEWIQNHISKNQHIKVFCGTGNNGGDGLAIARMLVQNGYTVDVYIIHLASKPTADFEINKKRIDNLITCHFIQPDYQFDLRIQKTDIIIDAVFGTGISRQIDKGIGNIIQQINKSAACVISIDVPSGLKPTDNSDTHYEFVIKASFTLTFEFPKLAFLLSENADYVGEWVVLPIGISSDFISKVQTPFEYATEADAAGLVKKRAKFSYKNTYGHALLLAGSYGKMGAAVMAAKSCMHSGAGLLTTHIPLCGYTSMQSSFPEAMVSSDKNENLISDISNLTLDAYQAIGIGPGIGTHHETIQAINEIVGKAKVPIVLDADALNGIAQEESLLNSIPEFSILTPHVGEFDRLVKKKTQSGYERLQLQINFSVKHKVILILKGAYTSISLPNGKCYFNSSGNPGMATAGSGDVLTGIILGLLAQNYSPDQASILGVYLHGLAGDIASEKLGQEYMLATDIIANLSDAFKHLHIKRTFTGEK